MRLEARNLSFRYREGGRLILDRMDLVVEPGERVGITAPSGGGKTTLLKILAGYEKPDSGGVFLDGRPAEQFRGYFPVQMVWQHPELSVNPRRKLHTVLKEGDWPARDPELEARIRRELGIEAEWLDRYPAEVSGGELQRFCIARAMGDRTRILLADEITAMLDLVTQGVIWDFLLRETRRRGISLVVVSHSEALLKKVCDRKIALPRGPEEI